jgi:hypothetical protein
MRLYKIYSGFEGFSAVFCLVIAKNESEAISLAIEKFSDYTHCTAEVVFDDLTVSKSSEPSE